MLQTSFSYLEELNEALQGLGLNVSGVQLETGSITPQITANQVDQAVVMRTRLNKRAHIYGEPMPGMVCFATCSDVWFHGETSDGQDICGFGDQVIDTTDTAFVGEMDCIFVPRERLRDVLHTTGANLGLERLAHANKFLANADQISTFRRMFNSALTGGIRRDQQLIDMLALLINDNGPMERLALTADDDSIRAFVAGCRRHAKEGKPMTISELCKMPDVLVAKTKLTSLCNSAYQMSPAAYYKRCRLEEARCLGAG